MYTLTPHFAGSRPTCFVGRRTGCQLYRSSKVLVRPNAAYARVLSPSWRVVLSSSLRMRGVATSRLIRRVFLNVGFCTEFACCCCCRRPSPVSPCRCCCCTTAKNYKAADCKLDAVEALRKAALCHSKVQRRSSCCIHGTMVLVTVPSCLLPLPEVSLPPSRASLPRWLLLRVFRSGT